jgi:hypothetical protein
MSARWTAALAPALVLALASCRQASAPVAAPPAAAPPAPSAYPVSDRGGTPATGPGDRFNHCERIWCATHGENFHIDHFLADHVGFVVHDELRGDVFVPRDRDAGPALLRVRSEALLLCGAHVHPWLLRVRGFGGAPIHLTGYNPALGYTRAHFRSYGTRLDSCCVNGAGSAFVHSSAGKQFRFHELDEFRRHPEIGWQRPFVARAGDSAR